MSFKSIDDRQVVNRAALPNIGSPSNDTLDDIFSRIDAILSALTSSGVYIAKKVALTSGTSSLVVTIPEQSDTSYIILAMMGNTTDAYPQYQQVEVTAKATTGFTFSWNHPVDSSNYFISYIIPFKVFPEAEVSIGSGDDTLAANLFMPQGSTTYPVIAQLQNITDANPQFQTVVVGSNTTTTANFSWNTLTDSANYLMTYGILATGQAAISNGVSSITVPLPVNYNSNGYAVVATLQNTVSSTPQYQPIIITNEGNESVTFGFNNVTDSSDYLISYYCISVTP